MVLLFHACWTGPLNVDKTIGLCLLVICRVVLCDCVVGASEPLGHTRRWVELKTFSLFIKCVHVYFLDSAN